MDISLIPALRFKNQLLGKHNLKTPHDIVSWMGAIQAQDYNMARWAVGIRLPGSIDHIIETAIDKGEILRTHVLRPTWHLVAAEDICWMLQLTAPKIRQAMSTGTRKLGLTRELLEQTNTLIRKILEQRSNLTRKEIGDELANCKLVFDNRALNHVMFHAELDGVVCSGISRNGKQTYALMEERVSKTELYNKDEALYHLAYKYYRSHGPATLQDFVWWSGLSTTDARSAITLIKHDFIFETINSEVYIYHKSCTNIEVDEDVIHFLPAFDEMLVSYKNRKEMLALEQHSKVITKNGIFKPSICHNGKVIGIWRKSLLKDNSYKFETNHFFPSDETIDKLVQKARKKVEDFF